MTECLYQATVDLFTLVQWFCLLSKLASLCPNKNNNKKGIHMKWSDYLHLQLDAAASRIRVRAYSASLRPLVHAAASRSDGAHTQLKREPLTELAPFAVMEGR